MRLLFVTVYITIWAILSDKRCVLSFQVLLYICFFSFKKNPAHGVRH